MNKPIQNFEQNISPRLRGDLRISQATESSTEFFVLEDRVAGRCFELGQREAHCLLACDGQRRIGEILSDQPVVANLPPLTVDNFRQLVAWALAKQLLIDRSEQAIERQQAGYRIQARANWIKWTNPISLSISLGNPTRFLSYLTPRLSWLFDLRWLPLSVIIVVYALVCLQQHSEKFSDQVIAIWADQQWATLLVVWLSLKVIHEIAHGIVALRYGACVRDAGVYLILFLPLAYVDISNSARLPNRWKRIHIAAAGMYVEIVLASLATIVWSGTSNVMLASWMHAIVVLAGVSTVLFNANPLMRFDGYFILADLVGVPNLATRGKRWFWATIKHWCLGIPSAPSLLPTSKQGIIALYGVSALVWRLLLQVTLLIGAAALFYGLGVFLAVLGILHFAVEPWGQFWRFFRSEKPWQKWKMANVVCSLCGLTATIWLLTSVLTGPIYLSAPAVVRFPAEQLVRAGTDGFVTAIDVQDGEQVVEGQRLAVLTNPELRHQVRALQLQLEQTEQQSRLAREKSAWSEYADQQSLAIGLRKQLAERQRESEALELRAPCSGRVFHPEIGELLGQYVGRGTSILTIDDGRKELVISISQNDMTSSEHWANLDVQLVFPNLPVTTGLLARIHPNASDVVPAPAMARRFGGPLLVQPIASTDDQEPTFVESQNTADQSARNLKLLVPRITGVVEIPTELQDALPVGQTGVAFLPAQRQSLASYLVLQTRRWLNGHLESMRKSMR